jgi:Peptidase family M41
MARGRHAPNDRLESVPRVVRRYLNVVAALLVLNRVIAGALVGGVDLDALELVILGVARKVVLSAADRRRTAYHEAGHALVGMLTMRADPVRKVSILPRGHALGVTHSAPDADRYEERELLAHPVAA